MLKILSPSFVITPSFRHTQSHTHTYTYTHIYIHTHTHSLATQCSGVDKPDNELKL